MADVQNPRIKALQNLSNQLPVANSRVAQGQAAAQQMQIQQAVKAAPAGTNSTQAAQQTGAAAAQSSGQQMIQSAEQNQKQQGQVGQLGMATQQQQAQANTASLQMGSREQSADNASRLARISEQAKQELYDKQMTFAKDEQGRTMFNERQLLDYAAANARDQNDYQNKAQAIEQASRRELQIAEHSYNLMNQDLEQRIRLAEQQKDQKLAMELAEMKRAAEEEMAKKRAKANNMGAMITTGGTIAGAVVGGIYGGPAGAAAGASVGGALGGMAASQMNNEKAGQ